MHEYGVSTGALRCRGLIKGMMVASGWLSRLRVADDDDDDDLAVVQCGDGPNVVAFNISDMPSYERCTDSGNGLAS